jgi:hypothetical protein
VHIPTVKFVKPIVADEEGYIADEAQDFQIMPSELVASYNKMASTLMLLHRYWAQVIDAAWEAEGDKEMFENLLREAGR